MEMLESALWVVATLCESSRWNDCKRAVCPTSSLLWLGDVTVHQGLKFGQLPGFVPPTPAHLGPSRSQ